ncbi:MAG: hypothetical protein U9M89_02165 [Patescibacteria group bacterium]|nr:hypothetical protein [Patescibacteria group bacterium]
MFRKLFLGFLATILAVSVGLPVLASPTFLAAEDKNDTLILENPINDDAYIAGGVVVINEDVAGDLFVAGGEVDINANIGGDLFIGGGNVAIRGKVGDDLRIGAGDVNIYGEIGDNVFIGAGNTMIADTALIRGDLVVGTGNINILGRILGNLKAGFGSAQINGTITGDADLRYGNGSLVFGDDAKIGGKLDYWAQKETNKFSAVAGSVEFHKARIHNKDFPKAAGFLAPFAMFMGALGSFLGILLIGGLFIIFMPKYLVRAAKTAKKNYWTALWQGFLFLVAVPILAFLIALTGFGIPAALIIMFSYIIILMLASIPAAMTVGSLIYSYTDTAKMKQFGTLVIGAAIFVLLGIIPAIGWLIKFLLILIGIGVIWIDSMKAIKEGRY